MTILYLLVPIGIVFLILAIAFFFWAIKNGQYDDMESQALKVVIEDHIQEKNKNPVEESAAIDDGNDDSGDSRGI